MSQHHIPPQQQVKEWTVICPHLLHLYLLHSIYFAAAISNSLSTPLSKSNMQD